TSAATGRRARPGSSTSSSTPSPSRACSAAFGPFAVRRDRVPAGAEFVDAFAVGFTGLAVVDERVDRMAGVCHLLGAVLALGLTQHRGARPVLRLRLPLGEERRPGFGAGFVAGRGGGTIKFVDHPFVPAEVVERLPFGIDD